MKQLQNFLNALKKCPFGSLRLAIPTGQTLDFIGQRPGPQAVLQVRDWKMVDLLRRRGDIGFGEGYVLGYWQTPNLLDCICYCAVNLPFLKEYALSTWWMRWLFCLYNNVIRANTTNGSRLNIRRHYDIGNNFYQRWLDPSMTYSSGLRVSGTETLTQAQQNKYQRILDLIKPNGARILEIGCGWGGFAEQAVKAGASITGITISPQQYHFARDRLQNHANILLCDYRSIKGKFDYIVSIEMFEAVGEKYWPTYFQKIYELLAPGGRAIIQAITIADQFFAAYRRESDYIRHYIFPGGMLPSREIFIKYARQAHLAVQSVFEFGQDYAWTLQQWNNNLQLVQPDLEKMGYDQAFLRSWEFYLNMSAAGFITERTNVMQIELLRP